MVKEFFSKNLFTAFFFFNGDSIFLFWQVQHANVVFKKWVEGQKFSFEKWKHDKQMYF